MNQLLLARKEMEKMMKQMGKGKMPNLSGVAERRTETAAAAQSYSRSASATKKSKNKRKKKARSKWQSS